jgi:hypothetical protein
MAVFFEFTSVSIENCVGVKKRVESWFMGMESFLVDEVCTPWWESGGHSLRIPWSNCEGEDSGGVVVGL